MEQATQPASSPIASQDRLHSLDVLRGFALLGILLLNIVGFGLALFKLGVFSAERPLNFYTGLAAICYLLGLPIHCATAYLRVSSDSAIVVSNCILIPYDIGITYDLGRLRWLTSNSAWRNGPGAHSPIGRSNRCAGLPVLCCNFHE